MSVGLCSTEACFMCWRRWGRQYGTEDMEILDGDEDLRRRSTLVECMFFLFSRLSFCLFFVFLFLHPRTKDSKSFSSSQPTVKIFVYCASSDVAGSSGKLSTQIIPPARPAGRFERRRPSHEFGHELASEPTRRGEAIFVTNGCTTSSIR